MSTANDNADISRMKTEADGAFKRKDASFRNHITKDGQFTPEKGTFSVPHVLTTMEADSIIQGDTIFTFRTLAVCIHPRI